MAKELLEKPFYGPEPLAKGTISYRDAENCIFEPGGDGVYLTRRPSIITNLSSYAVSASVKEIHGLFHWVDGARIIAVVKYTDNTFRVEQIQQGMAPFIYSEVLSSNANYITFAPGEKQDGTKILYIGGVSPAGTGGVCYLEGTFLRTVTSATLAATPSGGSVAYINSRFVTNIRNSSKFIFTDTNPATGLLDIGYWESSDNPLSCESKSDNLVGLTVHWNEIYAWGYRSIEIWQDDGVTPFVPNRGAEMQFGLISVGTVVEINNSIFAYGMLSGDFVVVSITNRNLVVISKPIESILKEYGTTQPRIATACTIATRTSQLYILTITAMNNTRHVLVYNLTTDTWTNFNSATTTLNYKYVEYMSAARISSTDRTLVALRYNSTIFETGTDSSDASGVIAVTRRTSWIDHNTWKRKRCDSIYLRLKRGQASGVIRLRWLDDGRTTWSPYYNIQLNVVDFISRNYRMGMYHSRRYEFTMSDNADFVLVGSDEDVTILRD